MPPLPKTPATALVLSGGGARAAYQVGVLQAIAAIRREQNQEQKAELRVNPFPIVVGTSAGAINAAALACGADDFEATVTKIAKTWSAMHADHIYQADSLSMARSGAQWLSMISVGWMVAKWWRIKPRSLLNNAPLGQLLSNLVPLERLQDLIGQGHLKALAITASSYTSGQHVTFFQGLNDLPLWERSQRYALRAPITLAHLLASSAIPFIFPAKALAVQSHQEYFGDGSMRQSAPLAPAIHLGADRILVIGAGRMNESKADDGSQADGAYPSLAQIAGHAMSSIFLDALAVDIERVRRINQTITLVPEALRSTSNLRAISVLVIAPSQRLDAIASKHIEALPLGVRTMLGAVGISSSKADFKGAAMASYLLFESAYTQELMALGFSDAQAQREDIGTFFGW
ncbi:MAG: patatin-like phospholipase family protein [Comamonadaceae bacterium]|nr:MAG: patatin-like phospholipase family protein [Comamonadaceae bacterium]